MRINGTQRPGNISRTRKGSSQSESASGFSVSDSNRSGGASGASAKSPIGGVDALLALQAVEEPGGRGARLKHGHDILDVLEDIKLDLLAGKVSADKLQRLIDTVSRRPDREGEGRLESVLDEIELRARVELAKLGREPA